jgi:hypothetical protein
MGSSCIALQSYIILYIIEGAQFIYLFVFFSFLPQSGLIDVYFFFTSHTDQLQSGKQKSTY